MSLLVLNYNCIILYLHLSLSLSWFQSIIMSFVVISSALSHCFKDILLVGIYPNRASIITEHFSLILVVHTIVFL